MLYVELVLSVPRRKERDALKLYGETLFRFDEEELPKVGGKPVGYWETIYGQTGEITMLCAYPSVDARNKVIDKLYQEIERWKKEKPEYWEKVNEWFNYSKSGMIKFLRPAPYSPLQ